MEMLFGMSNLATEVVFEGEIPSRLMFAAAMVNPEEAVAAQNQEVAVKAK
jgi:hypothetical protein